MSYITHLFQHVFFLCCLRVVIDPSCMFPVSTSHYAGSHHSSLSTTSVCIFSYVRPNNMSQYMTIHVLICTWTSSYVLPIWVGMPRRIPKLRVVTERHSFSSHPIHYYLRLNKRPSLLFEGEFLPLLLGISHDWLPLISSACPLNSNWSPVRRISWRS